VGCLGSGMEPLKLKAFCPFSYKREQLRILLIARPGARGRLFLTAMARSLLLVNAGEGAASRSAHAWICHCSVSHVKTTVGYLPEVTTCFQPSDKP